MEMDGLIRSIIGRLGSRLSSSKGRRIDTIESDPIVQQSVQSLVKLSICKIEIACSSLTKLLQDTIKLTPREDLSYTNILYAQLFVLKIVVKCLTKNWRSIQEFESESGLKDPKPFNKDLVNNMMEVLFVLLNNANEELENNDKFHLTLEENKIMVDLNININYSNKIRIISKTELFLLNNIQSTAGQCLFYLSASNWDLLFNKIQGKYNLVVSSGEEQANIGEITYLFWFNCNRVRLQSLIKNIEPTFNKLKKLPMLSLAIIVKRVIWNYIEIYARDFIQLHEENKNLEEAIDPFFDSSNILSDSPKKKSILYPLQIIMLCISPLMMSKLNSTSNKKTQFIENVKKGVKNAKTCDVFVVCYVDICKAASYLCNVKNNHLNTIIKEMNETIKERIFSTGKSTIQFENPQDILVISELITSIIRMDFQAVLKTIIPVCLDPDVSTVLPSALAKAVYNIFIEKHPPCNPDITSFSNEISQTLRKLFKMKLKDYEELNQQADTSTMDKKAKKAFYVQKELVEEKLAIIVDVLKIYQIDPSLIMMSIKKETQSDELIDIMHNITSLLKHDDVNLRTSASDLLVELHSTNIIRKWHSNKDEIVPIFWKASSVVLIDVAVQVINFKSRDEEIKYLADALLEILEKRKQFIESENTINELETGYLIDERLSSYVTLEIALLTLFCSTEPDICTIATQCFGLLCDEVEYLKPIEKVENLDLTVHLLMEEYRNLMEAGLLITGKVAQQKSIRKVLRLIQLQSPGNLVAWEIVYKNWRKLKGTVTKPPDEDPVELMDKKGKAGTKLNKADQGDQLELIIWQNYTGFLCSLGGCCLKQENLDKDKEDQDPRELVDLKFLEKKGTKTKKLSDPSNQVNRFIMELVELLICDNPIARETVRELLGSELTPTLYGNLFVHLESIIGRFFSEEGEIMCNDGYTLFVEQAISVLKLILERMQENAESLFTASLDMGNLLLSFARYLVKLGNGGTSLRVKMKMCQLTEILMIKRNLISLRKEFIVRNRLLVIIVEWVSDFAKSSTGLETTSFSAREEANEKFWVDLDLSCMKSVALLLDGLPLQPQEDTKTELERKEANSKLFYKLFGYFIKLLDRCRVLENLDVMPTTSLNDNADLQKMISKGKSSVKDLGPLKDFTILSLSNLLSANIESGLKYSLSMGYHQDTKTRTSFMKVLTNILKQGTEFAKLLETTDQMRFNDIISIVTDSDLTIAISFCDVCPVQDVDDCGSVVLSLYDTENQLIHLLKSLIEKEVNKTEFAGELFRRNSMASHLLASFAKLYGLTFLKECLMPTLNRMIQDPISCEVDPSKVDKKDKAKENLKNLKLLTTTFLDDILRGCEKMPNALREISSFLSVQASKKFPDAQYTSVGGFIYLRFLCPAIVAPDVFGLVGTITNKDVRRGLLLITKVIQNLANDVMFGAKEAYMIPLNELLNEYSPKVIDSLKLVSQPLKEGDKIESNMVKKMEDSDINKLHHYLVDNIERIGRDIVTRKVHTAHPLTNPVMDKEQIEKIKNEAKIKYFKLSTLLAQLGQPIDPKKYKGAVKATTKTGDNAFKEFMNNNAGKNINLLKEKKIFYEGPLSKEKRTVFYLCLKKIVLGIYDFDALLFYIFKTLGNNIEKPFELLIDVTGFEYENEVSPSSIKQLMNMIPDNLKNNLEALYIYNVNGQFQKFCNFLDFKITLGKKVHFPCNLAEIYDHIFPNNVKLATSTIELETDNGMVFSPVTCIRTSYNNKKVQSPSIVKILQENIQITMLKKQEILGMQSYFNEVYNIKDLTSISLTTNKDEKCLMIVINGDEITLLSPKVELICKALKTSKSKYNNTYKPEKVESRDITSSKVPGTLLNMALLNSGSEDSNLRLASYNMLYALSVTFKFDVDNQILITKDLCIPPNNTGFITNISEKLADTVPSMTFEFLSECFIGFKSSPTTIKHLCLEYMAPWLRNLIYLARTNEEFSSEKTKEILRLIFELTTKEKDMGPSIQSKIWKTLAQVDEIIDFLLDSIVDYSIEFGPHSDECDALADITVTLSSTNVRTGKLVSRLRKLINKTSINPSRSLIDHNNYTEIFILVRFNLMISFNNRLISQHYLPEIFHIICMLLSIGSPLFKASIHALIINVIQSLSTCLNSNTQLMDILTEFSGARYKHLFGIGRNNLGVFSKAAQNLVNESNSNDISTLQNIESLVLSLAQVLSYGALSVDQANIWRARWMSLVTSTAFQFNPAIQPRAFIVLGCLSKNEADDDLIHQILVALRGSLELMDNNDVSLIVSIVLCLSNLCLNYELKSSQYSLSLIWLAISILQMNHETLFSSAIQLLFNLISKLHQEGCFQKESLKELVLKAREGFQEVLTELEVIAGVNFCNQFEFSLSILISKGIRINNARKTSIKLLHLLLEISSSPQSVGGENNKVSDFLIAYVTLLLPYVCKNKEAKELFDKLSINTQLDNDKLKTVYQPILNYLTLQDEPKSKLFVSYLANLVKNVESEAEYILLYGLLSEIANSRIDLFQLVYLELQDHMNHVINSNQSSAVIDSVQSILYYSLSIPEYSSLKNNQLKTVLDELGFLSLLDLNLDDKLMDMIKYVCFFVESVIA